RPIPPTALDTLSRGLVQAVRRDVPAGAVGYSDAGTSFRLAAFAPGCIAVAPPGHVAHTKEERPYVPAPDARRFRRPGVLSIPLRYGADYLVVDRLRGDLKLSLPVLYRDDRFRLYRLQTP